MEREEQYAEFQDWTPAGQASADQHHAVALDLLRGASSFFLVTGTAVDADDEVKLEFRVVGGGATYRQAFDHLLRIASSEAVTMWIRSGFADEAADEEAGL